MIRSTSIVAMSLAAALAAGGANAQQSGGQVTDMAMAPMNGAAVPSDGATGPSATSLAMASQDQQPGQVEAVATEHKVLFTNGPIPDTAANRARYGQPLSHAGKRSRPLGN